MMIGRLLIVLGLLVVAALGQDAAAPVPAAVPSVAVQAAPAVAEKGSRVGVASATLSVQDTSETDAAQTNALLAQASEGFAPAFGASISMIIVSEIGDKTFFIAAIMAMRHNRVTVFSAAILALAVMTVLSAAMGFTLPTVLPHEYTHYAAACLFVFFGFRLLKDAYDMDTTAPNEELEEVENELDKKNETGGVDRDADAVELGEIGKQRAAAKAKAQAKNGLFSPIFVQAFSMTFLAEWGDRSQIATIALAAAKNPIGVTLGGIIGHALCTGLAVMGGKMLATRISERMVATCGGVLFLMFAFHSFYFGA